MALESKTAATAGSISFTSGPSSTVDGARISCGMSSTVDGQRLCIAVLDATFRRVDIGECRSGRRRQDVQLRLRRQFRQVSGGSRTRDDDGSPAQVGGHDGRKADGTADAVGTVQVAGLQVLCDMTDKQDVRIGRRSRVSEWILAFLISPGQSDWRRS